MRFTPSGQLLAVSLLDNTVKIFFTDSLKLLHNLYGHKLPVLAIDISSDSKLIATCGADKNVRLWGLDFGDCHKSFFAHQDNVMQVAFEKDGHNFFSAGKDRMIKYWDGDKFENIMRLDGHHGEVWAMCVSKGRSQQFVVSASHDKSIRVWEETDDQVCLHINLLRAHDIWTFDKLNIIPHRFSLRKSEKKNWRICTKAHSLLLWSKRISMRQIQTIQIL